VKAGAAEARSELDAPRLLAARDRLGKNGLAAASLFFLHAVFAEQSFVHGLRRAGY
jgi:hypothetical protein